MADRAVEEFERRQMWFRFAVEYGQKEDFLALIEAERQEAIRGALTAVEIAIKGIQVGDGSEQFRYGRETMQADALMVIQE